MFVWGKPDLELEEVGGVCLPRAFLVVVFKIDLFTYLFVAVLNLHSCVGFSLVAASRGYSLVAVRRLLMVVASLVAQHGL